MHLPQPIEIYFDADRRGDAESLLAAFTPDATVADEGHTHTGRAAIAAWWRDAKALYNHRAEPVDTRSDGAATTVRAAVTGDFPGSPATLTFSFRLDGGQITRLEISA